MIWIEQNKNIGHIYEYDSKEIVFHMLKEKEIAKNAVGYYRISTSCGCSSAKWDPKSKKLTVTYKAGEVPVHLVREGARAYTTTKYINITYKDGTTDTLSFSATVNKK